MKWVISIVLALLSLLYVASLFSDPVSINSNRNTSNTIITLAYNSSKATKRVVHTTFFAMMSVFLAAGYIIIFTISACNSLTSSADKHLKNFDS